MMICRSAEYMKSLKIVVWSIAGILVLCLAVLFGITCKDPIIILIDDKPLLFTDKYDSKATLLIPAAYTNPDGTIQGEYRIAGKTYGTPSRKERISLHPQKGLVISGKWQADYGFQQTVLVKNGKVHRHNDSKKRFRRALCTVDGQLAILQSKIPQTLNEFSQSLNSYCDNAVNLDTGDFGYGWYGKTRFSSWASYKKNKQTNWIYIK
jgi:hypothetical protein